jgi:hypothetical protein
MTSQSDMILYNVVLEEGLKLGDIYVSNISDLGLVQSELNKLYYGGCKLELIDILNNTINVKATIYVEDIYGSILSLWKAGSVLRYC